MGERRRLSHFEPVTKPMASAEADSRFARFLTGTNVPGFPGHSNEPAITISCHD